jgi:hypothetical protein
MRKALLFVVLVLLTGCRAKLNSESVVRVNVGELKSTIVDPISKSQTINISAKSLDGKFNLYCFLEKDQTEVEKSITQNKISDKVLAHELKTSTAAIHATIPANEGAVVLLTCTDHKSADVKLKITN